MGTIIKKIKFIAIISGLMIIISSCGESPFLDDEKNKTQNKGILALEDALQLPSSLIRVKPYWKSGPHIGDESRLLLIFLDENNSPVSLKNSLQLMLWMPTMDHGSFPVTVKEISQGVYEASELFFTMPGNWDIHIQQFENDNLIEEVKWSLVL